MVLIGIINKEGFDNNFIGVLEVNFIGEVFILVRVDKLIKILFKCSIWKLIKKFCLMEWIIVSK